MAVVQEVHSKCELSLSSADCLMLTSRTGISIKSAAWVNILEEAMPGVEADCPYHQGLDGGGVGIPLDLRHFEIKTLKLTLA